MEDVQLVLHVPVDVGEALLGGVVVGVLPLLVRKRWDHAVIELLDLGRRVLSVVGSGRAFRPNLPHPGILEVLRCR